MSFARLVLRGLAHYWRTGVLVAIGLAVAASVIVGSLVIGDSIRGSLRRVAVARLGGIAWAATTPRFVRAQLAQDVAWRAAHAAALMLDGSAHEQSSDAVVANASVIGVDADFWRLFPDASRPSLATRSCLINESLARDAGVSVGGTLMVTVSRAGEVAAGALFARREREDTLTTLRVTVEAVLPDLGVGGFRLDGSAQTPRNVFVDREWLAGQIEQPGSANTLVAAPEPGDRGYPPPERVRRTDVRGPVTTAGDLAAAMTLGDYGLSMRRHSGRVSVLSNAVTLTDAQVEAATSAAQELGATAQPVSVYLADTIEVAADPARSIAYAVVTDLRGKTGVPLIGERLPGYDGVWVNEWAREDLGVEVGDGVDLRLRWRVSTPSGYEEREAEITLRAIAAMEGLGADPDLVPEFEGITDAEEIGDWDPTFPIDLSRITDRDEEYWDRYRAAPRAFANPDLLQRMWGAEGGSVPWITSVMVRPPEGSDLAAFERDFARALLATLRPEDAGMRIVPVREQALAASQGTSDFAGLFLGMSMFLVFAGAGLAGTLMRLSAERRASQAGIMLATGFPARAVGRTIAAEGALLSVIGAGVGTPLGILYAHAVIGALATWWRGALGDTPALWVFAQPLTIAEGAVAALLVGVIATWWGARTLGGRPVLELLRGWQAAGADPEARRGWVHWALVASLAAAGGLTVAALVSDAVPAQGAFFGIGALLLVAALSGAHVALQGAVAMPDAPRSLTRLALRSAGANRGRSLLLVGLLASATCVIVTVAANSIDFSGIDVRDRSSGTGGFSLMATSSVPLRFDPATPEGRANLGFLPAEEQALHGVAIISLLRGPGEDISCLNIARPTHPRLLGVSNAVIERDGFPVSIAGEPPGGNPWRLLGEEATEGRVPAFGDQASVMWQIDSGLGEEYAIPTPAGEAELRFVGLLAGSIFQSDLLIAQDELRRLYPAVDGPSYFLIDAPEGREEAVADALRSALGDMGVQVRSTREVLNDYISVQNTYLVMFLALGGLGLLLGTIGLVAVILRSAFERRAEFALMLATGFTRANLTALLVVENAGLLAAGMAAGTLTALIAVAPHLASAQANVNWSALIAVLAAILVVGLAACAAGARSAVRGRLVDALRTE